MHSNTHMKQQEIADILSFLNRTKGLETIERYKASLKNKRNTVAEHSWRLGVMAFVIASQYRIQVNMERVLTFALLHDIAEAKTGDVDAYTQATGGSEMLAKRRASEAVAMDELTSDLFFGTSIHDLWKEYEEQASLEAKFIKALDKIEGFLHISEVGVDAYLPKEFYADYANDAVTAFDEATYHFPELKDFLDAVKKNLQEQFEKVGVRWIEKSKEAVIA